MKRAIALRPPKNTSAKKIDSDNPSWSEEMLGPPIMRRGPRPTGHQVSRSQARLPGLRITTEVFALSGEERNPAGLFLPWIVWQQTGNVRH
jgi:hypothetical protein